MARAAIESHIAMSPPPLCLAIVGTGLVGSKLISQIASLPSWHNLFRIVYIASSIRSLIAPNGIDLSSWKENLTASTEKPDLGTFQFLPDHTMRLLIFWISYSQSPSPPLATRGGGGR